MVEALVTKRIEKGGNIPTYSEDERTIHMRKATVICEVTDAGKDMVDLEFFDDDGNKYVTRTTGRIIENLADIVNLDHKEERQS